jgi:hypothetical protein
MTSRLLFQHSLDSLQFFRAPNPRTSDSHFTKHSPFPCISLCLHRNRPFLSQTRPPSGVQKTRASLSSRRLHKAPANLPATNRPTAINRILNFPKQFFYSALPNLPPTSVQYTPTVLPTASIRQPPTAIMAVRAMFENSNEYACLSLQYQYPLF